MLELDAAQELCCVAQIDALILCFYIPLFSYLTSGCTLKFCYVAESLHSLSGRSEAVKLHLRHHFFSLTSHSILIHSLH